MKVVRLFGCLTVSLGLFAMASRTYSSENTKRPQGAGETAPMSAARDAHSYSNPEQVRVRHVDLVLDVLFDRKILRGSSTLTIERIKPDADSLILDTRDLKILKAGTLNDGTSFAP